MASENGEAFVKNLAAFVRTHEKALANALQMRRRSSVSHSASTPTSPDGLQTSFLSAAHSAGSLTAVLSSAVLPFAHPIKSAKLTLTPHHLFYLLSRFEDLGIDVGPMNVRLENIHAGSTTPGNYVSFLNHPIKPTLRSGKDSDSIHSVSSVRSVMSNMSNFWSGFSFTTTSTAKSEKARAALEVDTKYLYSAFTKIPCLRLSQDRRARLISGFEEFPFDTAVPLAAFKNVSALEIYDTDFRQLFGWDRMADQLRSLTIKRGSIEDPKDLLVNIVIDDIERRRKRSSKPHTPSTPLWSSAPCIRQVDGLIGASATSPPAQGSSPRRPRPYPTDSVEITVSKTLDSSRDQSSSPTRPKTSRTNPSYRRKSRGPYEMRRSGSGSSESSTKSSHRPTASRSASNLLALGILPPTKWRLLRHLSLADNGLTSLEPTSFSPLSTGLVSLDMSSNLFAEAPDGLTGLMMLRALNLSNCLIENVGSLARDPLPAIESFNLRANKLSSLLGLETLYTLERLDVRDNRLADPSELGRLTSIPGLREIYVAGNPFTKSYSNYRVQIFNLFRGAAGHTDDIRIDGSGPSYSERKQLKDRAVANPGPSRLELSRPTLAEAQVIRHPSSSRTSAVVSSKTDVHYPSHSETTSGKLTKKRPQARKRLVELAVESAQQSANEDPAIAVPNQNVPEDLIPTARLEPDSVPHRTSSLRQAICPHIVQRDGDSVEASKPNESDSYRRKVEALKSEYGGEWLRALGEGSPDSVTENVAPTPGLYNASTFSTVSHRQAVGTGTRSIG